MKSVAVYLVKTLDHCLQKIDPSIPLYLFFMAWLVWRPGNPYYFESRSLDLLKLIMPCNFPEFVESKRTIIMQYLPFRSPNMSCRHGLNFESLRYMYSDAFDRHPHLYPVYYNPAAMCQFETTREWLYRKLIHAKRPDNEQASELQNRVKLPRRNRRAARTKYRRDIEEETADENTS